MAGFRIPKLARIRQFADGWGCMNLPANTLLERTRQPSYPNGERKLARDVLTQATWGLLGAAALAQLFLLVWLDLMS